MTSFVTTRIRRTFASVLICVALFAFAGRADAQTWTWNGGTADWGTDSNWTVTAPVAPSSVPAAGSAVVFNTSANLNVAVGGLRSLRSLTFDTIAVGAYVFSGATDDLFTFDSAGSLVLISTVTQTQTFNTNIATLGAFAITNGSTVNAATTGSLVLNGTLSFAGTITATGTGLTTINGNLIRAGGTQIANTGTGGLVINGAVPMTAALSFNVGTGSTTTINGSLIGTSALTRSGVGILVLAGDNSNFTGNISVTAGTGQATVLRALSNNAFGHDNTITVGVNGNGTAVEVRNGISIPASVKMVWPITTTTRQSLRSWDGNNTWNGDITVTGTGSATGSFVQYYTQSSGSVFTMNGTISGASYLGYFAVRADSTSTGTGVINGNILLPLATFYKLTTGNSWTISSTGNSWGAGGTNQGTWVADGTIRIGIDNALPETALLTMGDGSNTATFDMNGWSQTVGGLVRQATGGTQRITNAFNQNLSTLTINNPLAKSYGAVIADNIQLIKTGDGTQALAGKNTYTGGTTISGGALAADTPSPDSSTGTGAVAVNTAGTLRGIGNVAGIITLSSGGTIAPGSATNAGVLSTASQPVFSGGTFSANLAGGLANSSQLNITAAGDLALGSNTLLNITAYSGASDPAFFTIIQTAGGTTVSGAFSNYAEGAPVFSNAETGTQYTISYGTFAGQPGNVVLAPVPEPASILGLAIGALGFAGWNRRKYNMER